MKVAETSIRYSVLINMLTLAILLGGLISMATMPREEYPAVDFGSVVVVVPYPGASSAEIEQLITSKIEKEVSDLDGLDYITSNSEEGKAIIMLRFTPKTDPEEAYDNVVREVNKISDLPSDAIDPTILRLNMREVNPIAQIVVSGDFSPLALREIADEVKDGILELDDISKVDLVGARDRQIWVDVDQAKIDAYGISLSDISGLLQGRNLNIPGGTTRFGKTEFLVRTLGQFQSLDELGSMIVQSDDTGRAIRISDVATVKDTLSRAETLAKLNGASGTSILVYKKGDGNIIKVMQDVRNYISAYEKKVPGVKISVRNDGSVDVRNGINALGSSALQGIILVFLALLIFLGWRNALFASFGIPLSILITFIVVPLFGITLNNLTIFGLIIVVGMVVDNSIVVLENIHRYRELGQDHQSSIIMGVDQVISPVFSSTLTTVAAFTPLLLMTGIMGQFLSVFPIVVSIALLGSWFQSMIILPTNVYQFGHKIPSGDDRTTRLIKPIIKVYRKIVTKALHHRAITIWSVIILFLISLGILASGAIKFEFFPSSLSQTIVLELHTPTGSTLDETDRIVGLTEKFIMNMKQKSDIEFVVSNVGSIGGESMREVKTSNAQISIDLVPLKEMKYTHEQIKKEIRDYLDTLPGLYTYKFTQNRSGPPVGGDVEIRIKGENLDRLAYISDVVKSKLKEIPGVTDVDDSNDKGKLEVKIIPNQEKLSMMGLTVAQIASTIRMASTGSEVTQYRGNGEEEFPVLVKLADIYTQDLEILKNLKIRSRTGDLIAIRDLGDFEISNSISRIQHRDGDRVITVNASVTDYDKGGRKSKRTPAEVTAILTGDKLRGTKGTLSNFEQRFPGYSMEFGGVREEQRKSYSSLGFAFIIALLAIFTILASQFRSYVQPLIVMMTIPFAFIGVIIGLLVTGLSFGLNTLISVVALAGVVVNNAILLIDFINTERENGADRWHAIIDSGSARLRPIILTTATTVAGMLPLVFSSDPSSQAWRPLAVSFTFGLIFATFLTLFIIPVIYSMVDSFFGRFHMTRFKEHKKFTEVIQNDEV
ncbi:MAG TPA: efflux RND transporter permease subunit [Candidatus Cloacimonadota bacterium]|nr:efflux RND transporter permease subunit [Candidatus Cloacimonadota bacterium]HPS38767.1 efflux RND transporter permease subunit [Candidatus Cloacimonadota bacterium]